MKGNIICVTSAVIAQPSFMHIQNTCAPFPGTTSPTPPSPAPSTPLPFISCREFSLVSEWQKRFHQNKIVIIFTWATKTKKKCWRLEILTIFLSKLHKSLTEVYANHTIILFSMHPFSCHVVGFSFHTCFPFAHDQKTKHNFSHIFINS